jgi:hypothetical protein
MMQEHTTLAYIIIMFCHTLVCGPLRPLRTASNHLRCPSLSLEERLRVRHDINRYLHPLGWRRLVSAAQPNSPVASSATGTDSKSDDCVYHGPLTMTFRRLKIFSVSSLGLSCTLAPFFFILESSLPNFARGLLAGIAVTTSGISTVMIAWAGRPYVTTLRRLRLDGMQGVEMTTNTMLLRNLVTRVYDVTFLVETHRPMAKWELADIIILPPARSNEVQPGQEETVAETLDARGKVIGRWIVTWGEGGKGTCRPEGHVVRSALFCPSRI